MEKTNVFYTFIFLTLLNAEKMHDNVYYLINNQNKSFTIKTSGYEVELTSGK